MKSGFVAIVGRPNAGKSTLLNQLLGTKVSIVSQKAQTTRTQVRGILHDSESQIVFVDTPGIHKPRTTLGSRLNEHAYASFDDVDIVLQVLDASQAIGKGDEFVATRLADILKNQTAKTIVVLNKIDRVRKDALLATMAAAQHFDATAFVPISARTGDGIDVLIREIRDRLPEGPPYYPKEMITDVPEATWVAELVREALLHVLEDELPYAIATVVTEWEWPRIRCEIWVERNSQKGIVIGERGDVLKRVGQRVREQLEPGAFLELFVKVEPKWSRYASTLDRLGY